MQTFIAAKSGRQISPIANNLMADARAYLCFDTKIAKNIAGELPSLESVLAEGVSEFTPFFSKQTEAELMAELDNCECSRWYPAFMDITRKGVNKGLAVNDISAFLGISIAETMAIGDGDNDVPMLIAAGIGIAMGNSTDDVKSKADDVTDDIDNDGLSKVLRKYGVI